MNECPLTGKPCPKATLFSITEIKSGKANTVKCCEECFEEYMQGGSAPAPTLDFGESTVKPSVVTPGDVIQSLLELMGAPLTIKPVQQEQPKPKPEQIQAKTCPGCGCTLSDIAKTGKVGCAKCFDTFERPLTNVLFKAHGAIEHVGKKPKSLQRKEAKVKKESKPKRKMTLEEQIGHQESLMQEAIEIENYEKAAMLRDSLKLLRSRMHEIDDLRKKLDEAVQAEKFEEAAEIKKKIDDMLK